MTSSLPNQSASDWQSAFADMTACSQLGTSNMAQLEVAHSKAADDDLGFDPFHETQKALAEMLEKESISNGASSYSNSSSTIGQHHLGYSTPGHVQSLYSNSSGAVPPLTRHSPNQFSLGLGLGLGVGVGMGAHHPQPTRTRVPPPGFNPAQMGGPIGGQQGAGTSFGLSLPNMSNRPMVRSGMDLGSSKMLPFMNSSNQSNNAGGMTSNGSGLSSLGPRLFADTPSLGISGLGTGMSMGMGMGLGIGINNMGYNNMSAQNGSLNHMSANKTHAGLIHSLNRRLVM